MNGAGTQPEPEQPLLEFVVHNGAGVYDKPQTGTGPLTCQFMQSTGMLKVCSCLSWLQPSCTGGPHVAHMDVKTSKHLQKMRGTACLALCRRQL